MAPTVLRPPSQEREVTKRGGYRGGNEQYTGFDRHERLNGGGWAGQGKGVSPEGSASSPPGYARRDQTERGKTMWRTMHVHAYDVMGDVQLILRVTEEEGPAFPLVVTCEIHDLMGGVGEDDPREWARDALLTLLEDL